MRTLPPAMLAELKNGFLQPLLSAVLADNSLCLDIRKNYCNIYYKGGNLLRLSKGKAGYASFFDANYGVKAPSKTIQDKKRAQAWVDQIPALKKAIDAKVTLEREIQQLLIRENNSERYAELTDYWITDQEYTTHLKSRFDVVALEWIRASGFRKKPARLAIGEIKTGDNALSSERGGSGILKHCDDVETFLQEKLPKFRDEIQGMVQQKAELGLLPPEFAGVQISNEKPILFLVLSGHQPRSEKLRTELKLVQKMEYRQFDLRFAQASFAGFALFASHMRTLRDVLGE